MRPSKHFKRWVNKGYSKWALLCHFYVINSSKQYYGNPEFAYFNLTNPSATWIVAGTSGHGVKSDTGEYSPIPCLNCFRVDYEFCSQLISLTNSPNNKYEFGLVLDSQMLEQSYDVSNVNMCYGYKPLLECHKFDNPKYRKGVLDPFNYCQVVRVQIPKLRGLRRPIFSLNPDVIKAVLVRPEYENAVVKALKNKQMSEVEVFSAL